MEILEQITSSSKNVINFKSAAASSAEMAFPVTTGWYVVTRRRDTQRNDIP